MDEREALTHLRSMVTRGDHAELVTALGRAPWPADSLQLIGDCLLAAVRDGADGSADLARACISALRERGWAGDGELAEALDAALGGGPTPMLRPLPVDLEELRRLVAAGRHLPGGADERKLKRGARIRHQASFLQGSDGSMTKERDDELVRR